MNKITLFKKHINNKSWLDKATLIGVRYARQKYLEQAHRMKVIDMNLHRETLNNFDECIKRHSK